ncbi:MAG: MraY family glycosyltransferase [Actinomycetaceae bacterium]|nr:MraY family glycosyltransferase [Actinomycetaceae bacterium]MDY6082762.1 MraY family glycosyltransferase [Actinomycetaceae bacterium]
MRVYVLLMGIAAALCFFLVPVARQLAFRVGAITEVRARDVNTVPIPRLGGLAMYVACALTFAIASQIPYLSRIFQSGSPIWGALIGTGVMCVLGVVDDIYELDWYTKLAGEVLAAWLMAYFGVRLVTIPVMGLTVGSTRITMLVTVLVVLVLCNAVNFMDGLDGLAAGIAGIAGLAFFGYSYLLTRHASPGDYTSVACVIAAVLVGICAGFLPHNFHPAHLFMGDSGSLMLGVLISAAIIQVTGQIDPANTALGYALPAFLPLVIALAVIMLPIVDFVWAVVRRLARGQSPFHPDAGHLHHRLLRRGHSHAGAVLVLYLWAFVISFSGVALVVVPLRKLAPVLVVVFVGVIAISRWMMSPRRARHTDAVADRAAREAPQHAVHEGVDEGTLTDDEHAERSEHAEQ